MTIFNRSFAVIIIFFSCLSPLFAASAQPGLVDIHKSFQKLKKYFPKNQKVLRYALQAYDCRVLTQNSQSKGILTIVDYQQPSSAKRLWVIDLKKNKILFHTYVAHGVGSGTIYSTRFSNKNNSSESSIGLYQTVNAYNGQWGYALRLKGLDKGFNSLAYKRNIVLHSGKYVGINSIKKHGMIGMSHGCLVIPTKLDQAVVNKLKKWFLNICLLSTTKLDSLFKIPALQNSY